MPPPSVLFLCTHNSSRSQLGEGLLRQLAGSRFEVASAGTEVTRLHPMAARVLAERGIDPSAHRSKHLDEFAGRRFDWVITVCDNARDTCPNPPAATHVLHWSLPDPSAVRGEAESYAAYRATADEIATRLRSWLEGLGTASPAPRPAPGEVASC